MRHSQSGAVLVVSLIFVLILALVGVSGMRTVIAERAMATNTQYSMESFQAAETAIESAITDVSVYAEALNLPEGSQSTHRTFDIDRPGAPYIVASSATVSQGGHSLAIGFSVGEYAAYPFTITGTGQIESIGAESVHIQTVQRIGPKLN